MKGIRDLGKVVLGRRVCVYGGVGFHCERAIRRGGGHRVNVFITYGRFKSSTCACKKSNLRSTQTSNFGYLNRNRGARDATELERVCQERLRFDRPFEQAVKIWNAVCFERGSQTSVFSRHTL